MKRKPAHHKGNYAAESAKLRAAANANPATVCWRCGMGARPDDPWTAGHVNDGEVGGELRPEHRSCNSRAGAKLRNRRTKVLKTTRQW